MNGYNNTRQYRMAGNNTINVHTQLGDLYFHQIFHRDTLNGRKQPILEPVFLDGKQGQICVIDGEQCMHRLFGGGFQEWWTGGAYNETMDMLRNLEYYAFTRKCFIVVAFAGRLQPADEPKVKDLRQNEFLAKEYELVVKARKAL